MGWTSLCAFDELKEGEGKYVEIGGFQLAVFLDQGTPYVMDNECPHAAGSLSGGLIQDGHAVCPWHYWAFGLETGELRGSPYCKIKTYPVRLVDREGGGKLVQAELPIY